MKIDETVKMINTGTTTVKAHHSGSKIFVHSTNDFIGHDWFLMVGDKVMTWENVAFDSDCLEGVIPQDLVRVMDAVQRLLDTPLDKRKPEKKYCLEAVRHYSGTIAEKGYVKNVVCKSDYSGFEYSPVPFVFTEKELETMKKNDPVLAPAINAMKVEAKGDAC